MSRVSLGLALALAAAGPAAAGTMLYATAATTGGVTGYCLGPNGAINARSDRERADPGQLAEPSHHVAGSQVPLRRRERSDGGVEHRPQGLPHPGRIDPRQALRGINSHDIAIGLSPDGSQNVLYQPQRRKNRLVGLPARSRDRPLDRDRGRRHDLREGDLPCRMGEPHPRQRTGLFDPLEARRQRARLRRRGRLSAGAGWKFPPRSRFHRRGRRSDRVLHGRRPLLGASEDERCRADDPARRHHLHRAALPADHHGVPAVPESVQRRSFPLSARGVLQTAEARQSDGQPSSIPTASPIFRYRQPNLSRTRNDIRYNALALAGRTIIGAQFQKGRLDAFSLRDDGTLPSGATRTTKADVRTSPFRMFFSNGVLYVGAGASDNAQAYRLDANGLPESNGTPFSETNSSGTRSPTTSSWSTFQVRATRHEPRVPAPIRRPFRRIAIRAATLIWSHGTWVGPLAWSPSAPLCCSSVPARAIHETEKPRPVTLMTVVTPASRATVSAHPFVNVVLRLDPSADPATFRARLGSHDITSLFGPTTDNNGNQVGLRAKLPHDDLRTGRRRSNRLRLQVQGKRSGIERARTATDRAHPLPRRGSSQPAADGDSGSRFEDHHSRLLDRLRRGPELRPRGRRAHVRVGLRRRGDLDGRRSESRLRQRQQPGDRGTRGERRSGHRQRRRHPQRLSLSQRRLPARRAPGHGRRRARVRCRRAGSTGTLTFKVTNTGSDLVDPTTASRSRACWRCVSPPRETASA